MGAFFCVVTGATAQEADVAKPKEGERAKAAEAAAVEAEPGEFRNWVELGVGGNFVDGDGAQFRRRHGVPRGAYGGIEDLHFEQDLAERGLFTLDARAIFDNHDYAVTVGLSRPELGYIRGGYREFRTWYDGSGGYFPRNDQWFSLYNENFSIDRGELWIETGLRVPEVPEITLRYSHQFREGKKDSTIWGDTTLTTVPGANNTRAIVPTFLKIDETRDIFSADFKHGIGNTDVGFGVRYEQAENDNSRNIRRRPTEAADRYLTHQEKIEMDMFSVHATSDTRLNEKLRFTAGYAFTTLDTDISGSRIYGASYEATYDPLFARRQRNDEGFLGLSGGSRMHQHLWNLNLMWSPTKHLAIIPGIRVENQDLDNQSAFLETNVGAGPAFTPSQEELAAQSHRGLLELSGSLEARYTGFTNWVLYARGYWLHGEGDQLESETQVTAGIRDLLRDTDFDRAAQKYTVGANFYPFRIANFGLQYYHKLRNEDYSHREDSTPNRSGNRYPAFLRENDFKTDDVNARVTLRPLNNLTLVSRYDFQRSTIHMRGDGLNKIESAEITSHIFSQSISWTPLARLYLQGSINYVLDNTDTPASGALGANRAVLDSENDYWTATVSVGYALTRKIDVEASYFYYRADNYVDNSAFSQPYGAGAEEHGVTTTLTCRLSPRLRWRLNYGFYTNRDETSGDNNNYDAHMVSTSLAYLF